MHRIVATLALFESAIVFISILCDCDFPLLNQKSTRWYTFIAFMLAFPLGGYTAAKLSAAGLNIDASSSARKKRRFGQWLRCIWRTYTFSFSAVVATLIFIPFT